MSETGTNYGRLLAGDPRHGTHNAYKNFGCRCGPCKAALNTYSKQLHRRNRTAAASVKQA